MKTLIILIASFALFSCTDESATVNTLRSAGFTNISTDAFACGEDDTFSTGFVATNSHGNEVSVTVCYESATVNTLRSAGFTNISTTDWDAFACGEDDTFSTGFVATNSHGNEVSVTVCCGLLIKNCTIRF